MTRNVPEPATLPRPLTAPTPTAPTVLTADDLLPHLRDLARSLREPGADPTPRSPS